MNQDEHSSQQDTEAEAAPLQEESSGELQALQQELAKRKEQSLYHRDQWMRAAANLENYRKRVEKERSELLQMGQITVIAGLLPVLDDLERAFQTLPAPLRGLTWTDGLGLIERKLHLILEQQGLQQIEALGKAFDPTVHQIIAEEETTQYPDGQVTAVLQTGYKVHEKVVRPAMVKVARNFATAEPETRSTTPEEEPAKPKEDTA